MTDTADLTAALRAHARGLNCLQAAELLISHACWLQRDDFLHHFLHTAPGLTGGTPMAPIDWPEAIAALNRGQLSCSGGEGRMPHAASPPAWPRESPSTSVTHSPAWTAKARAGLPRGQTRNRTPVNPRHNRHRRSWKFREWINGHEWAKRQATQQGLEFTELSNGFAVKRLYAVSSP